MKWLARYWGLLTLVVLVVAWWVGGVQPAILLTLSLITAVYFFFRAPAWCGAVNRDGTLCRRNAKGALMGCSYRQHKWQKLKMTFVPHGWRRLNRGLWVTPREGMTTLAGLASVTSAIAAAITLALR
ncbi:hypothetical protein NE236_37015 [Actinoallomurus purpureus]|uniref:hypothetical protein n=1 Tax=Actinoallomurus purpureus TaxID=478114 RepID=UPI002092EA8C|nr:hypothetical protein [Actinoallomurus purpureus]MCO6010574.1 hypothetical protein [Actinoallomurus purpureus]